MKTIKHITAAALIAVAGAAPYVEAGPRGGMGSGTGPIVDIFAGDCTSVSGTLMEAGYTGAGYVIDTGTETVTVYGLGPAKYWEDQGVALPQVGEELAVDVCSVTFSDGTSKAIATSVTVDGTTLVLRDPTTGQPAWRPAPGTGGRGGQGGGRMR